MRVIFLSIFILFIKFSIQAQTDTIKLDNDLVLVRINNDCYVHISYFDNVTYGRFPSNGFIYINNNQALVFDTPITDNLTEILLNWLIDSALFDVKGLVVNHWHNDCQEGIELFQQKNITTYSSKRTQKISQSKNLPITDIGFKESLQISIGFDTVQCFYFGAAHTADNIVCYIPDQKILFGGCMVKSIHSRGLGNLSDAIVKEWPKTLAKVKDQFPDAEVVIPGHGAFGGIELIDHTLELLDR